MNLPNKLTVLRVILVPFFVFFLLGADMSLSVGMIAEELNMPMRLVSSQYKQKTGYGLLDRIHSFRVEKAKAMLLDTQDSVYEIAERCGYENVNTFIRVFRKYTGKTPGRFRGN